MAAESITAAGEQVSCAGCGRSYRCTPSQDYYNNTTLEDGVCEPCLLAGKTGAKKPTPTMTPLLKGFLDSGLGCLSPELAAEMGVDQHGEPAKDSEASK